MLLFPNAKINLGLYVTQKRDDGYHNLQTVFYPLQWRDALEVLEAPSGNKPFSLYLSGLPVQGAPEDNLLFKAYRLVNEKRKVPAIDVFLHKNIPMGAGLGGGSADAAFFLQLLNTKFELQFSTHELAEMAGRLGSDCPFFIYNTPNYAEGRGELFTPVDLNLDAYFILALYPNLHSSTAGAFKGIVPQLPTHNLLSSIGQPIATWKDSVFNDFEKPLFAQFPQLQELKTSLYQSGALYASMSGSGSTLFGIFATEPNTDLFNNYSYYLQKPKVQGL